MEKAAGPAPMTSTRSGDDEAAGIMRRLDRLGFFRATRGSDIYRVTGYAMRRRMVLDWFFRLREHRLMFR